MDTKYVLLGDSKVPIFKWKGYDLSWNSLAIWCQKVGIILEKHFEPDPIQPNWLTLFTGEKYSGGKGCGYRMVPGMWVAKLPGSWPFLMCYTKEEAIKSFKKLTT